MAEALSAARSDGRTGEIQEYVTFCLNEEMYAMDALQVQEIIELANITKVPHLPGFLKGVINLRGTIIPVVDLKMKFGMDVGEYRKHTCVIVTEFSGGVMGVIVDSVSDVMHMPAEAIAATPSFGTRIRTDFIRGMGRIGDNLVLVLDVDRVLSDDEVPLIDSAVRYGREGAVSESGTGKNNGQEDKQ
ncbi:MAG TPA: chemotaxis protein CheW [Dissulfurispiraceae bacterium]